MSLNVNGVEDMSNITRIDGAVNTYGWLPYLVAYVPPADSIQTVNAGCGRSECGSVFFSLRKRINVFLLKLWAAKDVAACHSISYNRWSSDCVAP
jgi:hypothetical protein